MRAHGWKLRASHPAIALPKLHPRAAIPLLGPPVWGGTGPSYVICTTPRSGSWLLSDSLTGLGIAGNPREWFNPVERQAQAARWRMGHATDLGLDRYLRRARALATTRNGVSGLKLHYFQFTHLPETLAAYPQLHGMDAGEVLRRMFPAARFIWLTRHDKLRQAISFDLASKTDRWWELGDAVPADAPEPEFDSAAIDRMARIFARSDAEWQAFFARARIEPLTLVYEDLAADPEACVRRVLGWIGVAEAETITIPSPRLRRQSDARSDDWAARFAAVAPDPLNKDADPQPELAGRPFRRVPAPWRAWIAQSHAGAMRPGEIAAVLMRHGYTADAIRKALHDP